MTCNLLIGGAAGQGIETTAAILERILKRAGAHVFSHRDLMSRIRGGHNFTQVRFGNAPVRCHADRLNGLVAFTRETLDLHRDRVAEDGFLLVDAALLPAEEMAGNRDPRLLPLPLSAIAKELGNPKVEGNVAVGALLRLFGVSRDLADGVLPLYLKESLVPINQQAIDRGYALAEPRFSCPPGDAADAMLLSGNRALALGAIAAGVKFYSAYPMSPSTSILEYLASKGVEAGIVVEQAEDEIAAVNMALGASFAGVRAMTGTSGGGFCLMVEALGFAGIAEIPLVVADIQRPGPATGLPTRTEQSDLKFVLSCAQGEFPRMVIALRHHADAFRQAIRAFDLADRYQLPVILLGDQYLADATATVPLFDPSEIPADPRPIVDDGRDEANDPDGEGAAVGEAGGSGYLRYRFTPDGVSPRRIPARSPGFVAIDSDEHDESGRITESADMRTRMVDKRMKKLEGLRQELQEPEFLGEDGCGTLLLGWGSLYGPLAEAVSILNADPDRTDSYGALVFGDLWPLPTRVLLARAADARRLVDVEQNATAQLADLVRQETGLACDARILKYDGRQLSGEEIASRIRKEARP